MSEILSTSESEWIRALDNMHDGALFRSIRDLKTKEFRFDYVGKTWEKVTGVSEQNTISDSGNVFVNILPDDFNDLRRSIYESDVDRDKFNGEVRYIHPVSKKMRWLQISSYTRMKADCMISNGFLFDVTARKEAEADLFVEKARLKALNDMPDGTLFRSARSHKTGILKFDYVSATWEKFTGVTPEDSLADMWNVFKNVPPEDMKMLMQRIEESFGPMLKFDVEVRYNHPVYKTERWLHIWSYPRRDENYTYSDGFIFDITQRKQIELKYKKEKERLETLNDNLTDISIFSIEHDTNTQQLRFSYISATCEQLIGLTADVVKSDSAAVFAVVHPEDLGQVYAELERTIRTLENFNIEFRIIKNDEIRWLYVLAKPRLIDHLIVSEGVMRDITDRKHNEMELIESKNRLTSMSDNLPDGVIFRLCMPAGKLLHFDYISAQFSTIFNLAIENVMDDCSTFFSMFHPEDQEMVIQLFMTQEAGFYDTESRIITYLGEVKWLHIRSSFHRLDDGLSVWDGFIVDITERKETELELAKYRDKLENLVQERTEELETANEELAAANEELYASNDELHKYQTQLEELVDERTSELLKAKEKAEESDRLKSAFLANMSHEIRTPLNGILGIIQFMDEDNISTEQRKEYMNIIEASSQQLTRIIEDVVDISKIESGQMTIQPIEVNLNELMNEMRLFFEANLYANNKENIRLILDDSGFIENCVVFVDPVRLRQIIINLLGNAIKFTEKGYIRFGYRQPSPNVLEFVVEDTGIGIAESQREIIFERFRQAELGNNRIYGGSGLGLTISRSLVKLKGGDMWVESTEGVGSSFYFTISV